MERPIKKSPEFRVERGDSLIEHDQFVHHLGDLYVTFEYVLVYSLTHFISSLSYFHQILQNSLIPLGNFLGSIKVRQIVINSLDIFDDPIGFSLLLQRNSVRFLLCHLSHECSLSRKGKALGNR